MNDPLLNSKWSNGGTGQADSGANLEWFLTMSQRMQLVRNIDALMNETVTEIRHYFQADRVLIYQIQDTQGIVLAESMVEGYTPSLGELLPTIAFGAETSIAYQKQPFVALNDVSQAALMPYQSQLLDRFQVKASLSLPISIDDRLWGVLVVQQCVRPRHWTDADVLLLYQIVAELKLNLLPLTFHNERQALAHMAEHIRQGAAIDRILQTATREIQTLLKVERVAICQFRSNDTGEFVAESQAGNRLPMLGTIWGDINLLQHQEERFRHNQALVLDAIDQATDLSPHQVEVLQQFEINACVMTAIFRGQRLWGMLCAYQHNPSRQWNDSDVQILFQMSHQLGIALQQADLMEDKRIAEKYRQELPAMIDKMSSASYIESVCQTVVQDIRTLLNVERVAIYRFRPDYFGDFIYESESGGFPKLVGSAWEDTYVQEHQGGRLRQGKPFVADDVYSAGLSACHIATLEHFGIKSFAVVAIKQGEQLWGLLSAFQHSQPRRWLESEVALLADLGRQLGRMLQGADYLLQLQAQSDQLMQAADVNQSIAHVIPKMLQSRDLASLFRLTSQATRQVLKCDRVVIYRFDTGSDPELVAESIARGGDSWQGAEIGALWQRQLSRRNQSRNQSRNQIPDPPLDQMYNQTHQQAERGSNRDSVVVKTIYTAGHLPDELSQLEDFEVSAYIITPIVYHDVLWGCLGVYQLGETRSWAEVEVNALTQIAIQVGTAMQQLDYLKQVQQQSEQLAIAAERERLVTKIIDRIRQISDLNKAFKTTTREIRTFLKVDRVAIFKFDLESGYSVGETIAEDVRPGYVSALSLQVTDHCFSEGFAEEYRNGRIAAIADIEQAGLPECYIDVLSQFQVRANLVVPLLKGENLWGLFCIHQCDGPRQWHETDIEFAKQIAAQLNIAIQQGEYVERLQQQSEQLADAARRDKAAKEKLQQDVIQLLTTVRPALSGDLTVRAPVTDTEVGTIADAYNNTLGSLQQLVMQMQAASSQISQISQTSEPAIAKFTAQAQVQVQTLNQAVERVQRMVHATQAVETNAQQVETAVQQANQTVMAGDAAIDRTVSEMNDIREIVLETNHRLQRLSESSQKISRVVNLIGNFTTQTQLLALNASIEATRAGEFGRGFAVVADEVRSLARQSADAATEIEQLVQDIQASTAEVATAMETEIEQVASGTEVVNEARQNLNAIVNATTQISQLVIGIIQSTQEQTQECQSLTQIMTEVAAIAHTTSQDSVTMSASFSDLLNMAQTLQARSDQFKVN
jgi:methyl-accepting chemotaxis protein PixJ